MAEGALATGTGGSKADDASRGRPYYDKLRKDLKETLEKKRELNKSMANLEATIARAEHTYLEETSAAGNIIKGFDNYIKASASAGSSAAASTATRRKGGVNDQDKIFSNSSVSWNADPTMSLALNIGSVSATPSEAPTPSGVHTGGRGTPAASGKAGNKKKKSVVDKNDAEGEERPTKRGKVSWGGRDTRD